MTHGATRGTNAAELAAHPPRRRGIAAMEAEGWPPEPDVEWRFRSSSDSDCVLGDAPAALADDSDADADVRLGAATAGRRLDLGAADETQRLGVPADADTDGGDGPGGVALGVGVDTDTDHDGGGLGGVGADSDLENPGGEGGTGLPGTQPGTAGAWLRGPWRPGQGGLPPVAQTLVTRVLVALQRLPRPCLQAVVDALATARHHTQSLVVRAASALIGLAPSRIWRTFCAVRGNGWSPVPGASDALQATARYAAASDVTAEAVMLTLVRTALGVGSA